MVTLISFGYKHGKPPEAHLTIDLRKEAIPNPYSDPLLRSRTGADPRVRSVVLASEGGASMVAAIVDAARACEAEDPGGAWVIAIGCTGGKHRSWVIADEAGRQLGPAVRVKHRDAGRL